MGQLDRPAIINTVVEPASLPDLDSPPPADLTRCTVSGWGVTWLNRYSLSPVLRSVDVDIFSNCWYYYYFRITDNMVCAGSLFGGKDSCQVRHKVACLCVWATTLIGSNRLCGTKMLGPTSLNWCLRVKTFQVLGLGLVLGYGEGRMRVKVRHSVSMLKVLRLGEGTRECIMSITGSHKDNWKMLYVWICVCVCVCVCDEIACPNDVQFLQ